MSNGPRRRVTRSSSVALIILTMLGAAASPAYADGDPASDVLAVQRLFVPTDARISVRRQLQLSAMLAETAREGYRLRVAIIGSPNDLGSVTAFWRRPETYARFLGSELSLVYHGTLLVVMPNGYGSTVTSTGTRTASGEAQLPLPGDRLGAAAITAVERFAAGAGTPIRPPDVQAQTVSRSGSVLPWLVFGLGFVPLALAWGMSIRRRPLTRRIRHQ